MLEKSASDIIPLIDADYERATKELRNRAIKFIITDSQGKALVKNLEAKTYYVCGISRTHQGVGVWNVRVDMQYGKNSLTLNNKEYESSQLITEKPLLIKARERPGLPATVGVVTRKCFEVSF